jgi:predicted Zn-dependent peptidase
MLQDFHNKNYSADKSVLMGLDVDHDTLISFGEKFKLAKGGAASLPSKYHNGESRCECGGNQAFIALAAESAPATNVKEAVATMILQQVLGTGARVKRGNGQRQLQKATSSIGGEHSVSAINYTYSDAGLMGAFIASDAQSAGQVTGAVVAALRSVHVTEAELTAAKKSLQIYLDDQMHSPPAKLEAMAAHLAFGTKEAVTPSQMADLFTKASLSDVQAAAKKLANAKFSMGAAGNLGSLPFIDQL